MKGESTLIKDDDKEEEEAETKEKKKRIRILLSFTKIKYTLKYLFQINSSFVIHL
jgi:hypothetical protein